MTIQAASGLRDELRSATRELHQATDELVGSVANVGSLDGYPIFLAVMHDVFAHFGPDCDRVSEELQLPARAERLQACLASDLRALGTALPTDETLDREVQSASSLKWAYGSAYALEGSALGAAVLQKSVCVEHRPATGYLDSLVSDRRSRWPTFTKALDALEMHPGDFDEMTRGASAVFERVQFVTRHLGGVQ